MKLETKVQAEAIKMLEKRTAFDEPGYAESTDGKRVYITLNGFWAVRIAENGFWLDKEKIKPMPA